MESGTIMRRSWTAVAGLAEVALAEDATCFVAMSMGSGTIMRSGHKNGFPTIVIACCIVPIPRERKDGAMDGNRQASGSEDETGSG